MGLCRWYVKEGFEACLALCEGCLFPWLLVVYVVLRSWRWGMFEVGWAILGVGWRDCVEGNGMEGWSLVGELALVRWIEYPSV